MDNKTWSAINSMNNMKNSFAPKRSKNFGREKESTKCQEYDEVFIWLYYFAERYLDKLVDE